MAPALVLICVVTTTDAVTLEQPVASEREQVEVDGTQQGSEKFYYYDPDGIGAHAFHDPINIMIAGGFGALYNRRIDNFDFSDGGIKLAYSITHPLHVISEYGWKRFLMNEVIPNPDGQGWNPNWGWHLIGGGFRNRLLKEYYMAHGYRYPTAAAWLTSYTFHFLNELLQAQKYPMGSVDAVADLFIFDWIGKVLFEIDAVNEFATGVLHLSEWSYQTQWNPYTNRLVNNGQLYWLRFHLWGPLSVSAVTGEQANTVNLTLASGAHQFSFGFGGSTDAIELTRQGDAVAAFLKMSLGFYYSRNDNPLVTVTYQPGKATNPQFKDAEELKPVRNNYSRSGRLLVNVYPGIFSVAEFDFGISLAWYKDAFFFGISSGSWPIGFSGCTPLHDKYMDDA